MKLAQLQYSVNPTRKRIIEFKGINKKAVIDDGEMRDMYNLCSDDYPCLTQRKPRGIYSESYVNPRRMIVKNKKLAVISENYFYYNEKMFPALKLSESTEMVAINNKICFFPEKLFFDVVTEETGTLEAHYDSSTKASVTLTNSTVTVTDGTGLDTFKNGDVVDLKFEENEHGTKYDISTIIVSSTANSIEFPGDTFIFEEKDGEIPESITFDAIVKVDRNCPDLDYVMESNNRLWGVCNADNTIYGCKLGDPTNWFYYQATSLDSYAVAVGTDGEWTGCIPYSSHLLFFKEDCIHKLYGNTPATYQLATAECYALEKGSSKSIAVINEIVFYKSRLGIMAYGGGNPELVSACFGVERYLNAVAGTDGIKYYVSMEKDGVYELLVFDVEKALWHKEDNLKADGFAFLNGKLLYISNGKIFEINSDNPQKDEGDISWYAELGPYTEYIEEHKIYSKMKLRIKLEQDSELEILIKVDDGDWERLHHYYAEQDETITIPIVPRRCFKFAVKLQGKGRCKVESFVRDYREGAN